MTIERKRVLIQTPAILTLCIEQQYSTNSSDYVRWTEIVLDIAMPVLRLLLRCLHCFVVLFYSFISVVCVLV